MPSDEATRPDPAAFEAIALAKRRLSLNLIAVLALVYAGFLALVSYAQAFLATPVGPVTAGIVIGLGVVVVFCGLCLVYVARANHLQAAADRAVAQQGASS